MKQKQAHKPIKKPVADASVKKEIKKVTSKPFFLDSYMEKYSFWITMGLVLLLILIIFHNFIVGNVYYLFKDIGSDSVNFALPHITLLSRYLHSEGFPTWSFSQGMGQNIMPSISDPFSWIIIAMGPGNAAYGFIWMELIKMGLTALFFYLFLKQLRLSSLSMIIGTILYTFSGFIIIGGEWNIFSSEACFLALLLLGFERLYQKNSWYLFPVAIALITMLQPFDLYLYGLFLIFYILLRHFTSDDRSWLKLSRVSLIMAGLVVVGLLISSFFLVSSIQQILDSPRVGGNSSYANELLSHSVFGTEGSLHNITAIMRFFSNDLLGNGSNFKGWYNYLEAPLGYIGLLPLLLFPQIFIFIDRRKKIIYGVFLAIFLIPLVFPFFRYAFWLFTGDYYRGFSLFISLTFLLFSLFVITELDKVKKVNLPLLAATLVGWVILLYYPYENIDQVLRKDLRSLTLIFLLIYSVIIIFLNFSKNRFATKMILICFVLLEVGFMNSKTINERVVLTKEDTHNKIGYNDYSVDASAFVKSIDKGFFRVNKEYFSGPAIHNSYNDAKIQDYFGTPSYTSFNQKYYIRFLEETGVIEKGVEAQSRWAPGLMTSSFFQFFGSVKYHFTKQQKSPFLTMGYDFLTQIGDVKILKSNYFLPLGYSYDTFIPLTQFQKLSRMQKQFVLLKAFVAEEPIQPQFKNLSPFSLSDTSKNYTWQELAGDINARKADTMKMTGFSNNRITGTIDLKQTKLVFFSIPFDKGWHCKVNGKATELVLCNIGFQGLFLEPGKYTIELFYKPPYFSESLVASLVGLLIYLILAGFKFLSDKKRKG